MPINSSEDQFSYYKSSHNILASNDKFRTLNTTQITFLCVNGDENTYSCMLQWDTLLIQAPSRQRYIVQQPQSWWMQLWRETLCQDPPSSMIKDGSMVCQVPSRERIHIPPIGEKENQHLQKCVGKGYVSSQEGMQFSSILSFGGISFQTSMLRALFSLRAGVKSNMRRCHLPRCPTRMLGPSFYSNQYINLMVSRLLHHPTTNETGSVKYLSLPFWPSCKAFPCMNRSSHHSTGSQEDHWNLHLARRTMDHRDLPIVAQQNLVGICMCLRIWPKPLYNIQKTFSSYS